MTVFGGRALSGRGLDPRPAAPATTWRAASRPSGVQPEASAFRYALERLRRKHPGRWGEPTALDTGDRRSAQRWPPLDYYLAGSIALVMVVAGSALMLEGHRLTFEVVHRTHAEPVSPRLAQIAAAARPAPIEARDERAQKGAGAEARSALPVAVLVADESALTIEQGQRALLAARIENPNALQPETSLLVHALPAEVRLSEGILIAPGVWMMRADLLGTAEIEVGQAAVGRHAFQLELRTPEGSVVSSAQLVFAVAAAPARSEEHVATPALREMPRTKAVRTASPPVERGKPVASTRAARKDKLATVTRSAPETRTPTKRGKPQGEVTVLAASPSTAQSDQPARLIWPGDDPRATYAATPPVFLGGNIPDSSPPAQRSPSREDTDWRGRVFEGAR